MKATNQHQTAVLMGLEPTSRNTCNCKNLLKSSALCMDWQYNTGHLSVTKNGHKQTFYFYFLDINVLVLK